MAYINEFSDDVKLLEKKSKKVVVQERAQNLPKAYEDGAAALKASPIKPGAAALRAIPIKPEAAALKAIPIKPGDIVSLNTKEAKIMVSTNVPKKSRVREVTDFLLMLLWFIVVGLYIVYLAMCVNNGSSCLDGMLKHMGINLTNNPRWEDMPTKLWNH